MSTPRQPVYISSVYIWPAKGSHLYVVQAMSNLLSSLASETKMILQTDAYVAIVAAAVAFYDVSPRRPTNKRTDKQPHKSRWIEMTKLSTEAQRQ